MMKKSRKNKNRGLAISFTLSLAIVLAVAGIGTIIAGQTFGKILFVQYKIVRLNNNISGWEQEQKQNYELSQNYIGPYARIAENAGKKIENLKLERSEFLSKSAESSDPVIRWAVKNEGNIPTVVIGILGFIIIALLWIALFMNLAVVTAIVFKVLNSVVCIVSNLFSIFFYGLHLGCYRIQVSSCKNCSFKCKRRIVPCSKRIG